MKLKLLMFLLILIKTSIGIYDKYTNRDSSLYLTLRNEYPFYASKKLYSNHYMKLNYNNSSIIFS